LGGISGPASACRNHRPTNRRDAPAAPRKAAGSPLPIARTRCAACPAHWGHPMRCVTRLSPVRRVIPKGSCRRGRRRPGMRGAIRVSRAIGALSTAVKRPQSPTTPRGGVTHEGILHSFFRSRTMCSSHLFQVAWGTSGANASQKEPKVSHVCRVGPALSKANSQSNAKRLPLLRRNASVPDTNSAIFPKSVLLGG